MTEPNTALRAARLSLLMSQDDLARAVRDVGQRTGEPNDCTKRLIQRWEAGEVTTPRAVYARALEHVTGQPIENLGFRPADERYGLDRAEALKMSSAAPVPSGKSSAHGPLTGIWHSWYEYYSSGREATFTGEHYVVILQHGSRLQVRSLSESSDSPLFMDLSVNGQVITGNWTEQTHPDGYYQGAVYHGAIQMLLEPTGRKMAGKWVGFGREFDVNTGPWNLTLVTASVAKDAMAQYNRRPTEQAA